MVSKAREGLSRQSMSFDIHVVTLGPDVAIIGMPGEMFSEYQLKLQASSPFATTIVLGYTNGCHGYVDGSGCLMRARVPACACAWSSNGSIALSCAVCSLQIFSHRRRV